MNTKEVLALARKHLSNDSSRLCLADAVALEEKGELEYAKARALKSLAYSVGVFHSDYKKAAK